MLRPLAHLLGRDLRATALEEAAAAGLGAGPVDVRPVADDDLADLPEPAQRYLRFMGVVGRARDWSFVARLAGRFRRGDGAWMPCDAWQYNSSRPVGRVFHMRIDFARVVPMVGHDTYLAGRGRMIGKVVGFVTVADGKGPEFDEGELVTYLNDATVLAPSMLLDGAAQWSAVDDDSFDVTFTDAGRSVTGRVLVDERGAMRDFATTNRFADLPGGMVRARWTTPIDGWTSVDGRLLPTRCQAIWDLPDGPLAYVDGTFVPGSLAYNLAPRDGAR